jgi:hypothetical protein
MKKRYLGCTRWRYKLPDGRSGTVEFGVTSGNRADDEGQARYMVRKKFAMAKLPKRTQVFPDY